MNAKPQLAHMLTAVLIAAAAFVLGSCSPPEPRASSSPPDMRRLTDEQYRNTIADIFGGQISVGGRGDPLLRTDGLLALGARTARVTPSGFDQYYALARSISAQVTNVENRHSLIPCQPASETAADDACARRFYSQVGRLLYRRPLAPDELQRPLAAANQAADTFHDFYRGIAVGLTGMLSTPKFLFVVDSTEPDPARPGAVRLTPYAKAARLSFFLWNTTPDDALLTAAEKGELDMRDGLARTVERMMASDRIDVGVRAFFVDFLNFERFETLEKDTVVYPAFNARLSEDAREQVLRTVISQLVTNKGDYRDLFTTRKTFLTGTLARVYRVPLSEPTGEWMPYEFPPNDPRAGLATQIGFVALASHPGRSSPTLRGRAIREILLCQKVPDPPGDVDFTQFEDPKSPNKTARDRLTVHSQNPSCAGCHKMTDPIGLGFENFDGLGQIRDTENGAPIDASGELDGVAYHNAPELAAALRNNPALPSCFVHRLSSYALGRGLNGGDNDFVGYLEKTFAKDGYDILQLLRRIALSESLYAVAPVADPPAAPAAGTPSQKDSGT